MTVSHIDHPVDDLGEYIKRRSESCLEAYRVNPQLIAEHSNIERATAQGGYGHRQLYELIQNASDALINDAGGRIQVILTRDSLYCANEGAPIDSRGIDALLGSHLSNKRGTEIGRFGLGFKSVLAVSHNPEFLSRTVSFTFNRKRSEAEILRIDGFASHTPALRLAQPIDLESARREDLILDKLLYWATTVIKLPLISQDSAAGLAKDISDFPAEFLIFSSHVGRLQLEYRPGNLVRDIRVRTDGATTVIQEGETETKWKLFKVDHSPSAKVRDDAGFLADRESIPVMWAAPLSSPKWDRDRGQFWAFYPTTFDTTLSGILNAPWKTNEDRQNLLEGGFNRELLEVAANLIASNMDALNSPEDRAKHLDLIPARGREASNWADKHLGPIVYGRLAQMPSLPDQSGQLREPKNINVPPGDIPTPSLEAWAQSPSAPVDWLHIHAESTRIRRGRVDLILETAKCSSTTLTTWLNAATHSSPAASSAVLKAAALIVVDDIRKKSIVSESAFLLTSGGDLVAPQHGKIFLKSTHETPGLVLVHPDLAAELSCIEALMLFGIEEADASSTLEALLATFSKQDPSQTAWLTIWNALRAAPETRTLELLKRYQFEGSRLRVRTRAGAFRPIPEVLLPREIASEEPGIDDAVAVDVIGFHKSDVEILRAVGVVKEPDTNFRLEPGSWFQQYLDEKRREYLSTLSPSSSRPDTHKLSFGRKPEIGPLNALAELSSESKTKLTGRLLSLLEHDHRAWMLRHDTVDHYPSREFESPYIWLLRKHGRLRTSLGIRTLERSVSPVLRDYEAFLSVAVCSQHDAQRLSLPAALDSLDDSVWEETLRLLSGWKDEKLLGWAYSIVCRFLPSPPMIQGKIDGNFALCDPKDTIVGTPEDDLGVIEESGRPYLVVSDRQAREHLAICWSLLRFEEAISVTISPITIGDAVPLESMFPGLSPFLDDQPLDYSLVPCESIRNEMATSNGRIDKSPMVQRSYSTIYWVASMPARDLLNAINDELRLQIPTSALQSLLENRARSEVIERKRNIAQCSSLAEKLLLMLGADFLKSNLPQGLLDSFRERSGNPNREEIAELALTVYGIDSLKVFRDDLVRRGVDPPATWNGSDAAKEFVRSLGFPDDYAGFPGTRRNPTLLVDGPIRLQPLHPFQQESTRNIRALIRSSESQRGLLSLPTGAGKTRVTVQSIIEAYVANEVQGPILWIAQSDELCEQAVQTWSDVWRGVGPEERLTISRHWGQNFAIRAELTLQVVVATIDKLKNSITMSSYDWLAKATIVAIDEAHGSISPEYTDVLNWLGLGRNQAKDRTTLIGMTATPFRGGTEETNRLVFRYGGNRLDTDVLGEDQYQALTELGVLARVDHKVLAGTDLSLEPKELADLTKLRKMPASVEARLGRNVERNNEILDSIMNLDEDWPKLVFAASVEHAETLAGLLAHEGIPAATISSKTDIGARRRYIDRFKSGEIKVLTNYGVLAAGFDAPSVRALFITRPTYSPVLYQQMIGRGLRGPLNGGKERCLIVDVEDNIHSYGGQLAFRDFEFLWKSGSRD